VSLLQNLADMDVTYKALQVKLFFPIRPSFPSLFGYLNDVSGRHGTELAVRVRAGD